MVELLCRIQGQLGQRIPEIGPGVNTKLLVGGGEAHCPLISLNIPSPFCTDKRIHLRVSTKDNPKGWFTDLLRLNSKAR